jgi:hypothetical protein
MNALRGVARHRVRTLSPMKGGLTVTGDHGSVRIAITGLDLVGMEEETPSLVKMSPEEARELAETLLDAARQAEAE